MTTIELARLVKNMRAAQDECFVEPTQWNQTGARRAEADVDAAVKQILDNANIAEGEQAFEAGSQEWADWNMANNPFGD